MAAHLRRPNFVGIKMHAAYERQPLDSSASRELVKRAKKSGEEHKLGVRGSRREAIAMLKEFEKEGELSKDESRRAQTKVQDLTDEYIAKIDQAIASKEEEILRI